MCSCIDIGITSTQKNNLDRFQNFIIPQLAPTPRGNFFKEPKFKEKQIRPIKKEDGKPAMDTLFHHLTTCKNEDNEHNERIFEMDRSLRLHWVKHHIELKTPENIIVFSYLV